MAKSKRRRELVEEAKIALSDRFASRNYDLIIVGGGAFAAFMALNLVDALRDGCFSSLPRIALVEQNPELLRKLKATGNGRCNLGNRSISSSQYFSCESDAQKFYETVLASRDPNTVLDEFYARHAVLLAEEEGRIYPHSRRAKMLQAHLCTELATSQIELICSTALSDYQPSGATGFQLEFRDADDADGDETIRISTRYLVIASAGLAAEELGSGRSLLKKVARTHRLSQLSPGLVALRCRSLSSRLSGLRVRARLHYGALPNLHLSEQGEILFCDYGLSGIAAMDLSSRIASSDDEGGLQSYLEPRVLQYCRQCMNRDGEAFLFLELFPDRNRAELSALLRPRMQQFSVPCDLRKLLRLLFSGILDHDLLAACIDRFLEIYYDKASSVQLQSAADLEATVDQFIRFLSCLPMEYHGLRDYRHAQIMVGGVLLSEIDDCLESRSQRGLFLGGEILDIQGRCGGFNLQWMLISASYLAPIIAKRLKRLDDETKRESRSKKR